MANVVYTIERSVNSIEEVPKGGIIQSINGKTFVGFCEACGRTIVDTQKYIMTVDEVFLCGYCKPKLQEAHR